MSDCNLTVSEQSEVLYLFQSTRRYNEPKYRKTQVAARSRRFDFGIRMVSLVKDVDSRGVGSPIS